MKTVECLGACGYAPMMQMGKTYREHLTAEKVDAIICPTAPAPAFKIGEIKDPLQMYLADIFTIAANLAGICGISVPCGFASGDLPIGLQLLAPAFAEARMFEIAHLYEQSTAHHQRRPAL